MGLSSQNEDKLGILEESLKAMLLCHNTKTKFNKKSPDILIHETQNRYHAASLGFCRELGFSFEGNLRISADMIPVYKIHSCEFNEFYPILSINEYSAKRNRFSILVNEKYSSMNNPDDLKATLYVWSLDFNSIINNLDMIESGKEKIKEMGQKLRELGYQIMFYCKREMTYEEKNEFLHKKGVKQTGIDEQSELDDLYNQYECNLSYLVGVYFEYELCPFANESIINLKEAKMKLFLLSEDDEDKAMSIAYKTKILNEHSNIKKLLAYDQESLATMIKYTLNNLKKDLFHEKPFSQEKKRVRKASLKKSFNVFKMRDKFIFIVDGPTFELILKSKSSFNHFKFLTMLASHFIGYNMSPILKKELLMMSKKLNQEIYDFNILAIGKNQGDLMMLQEADISFQISEKKNEGLNEDIYMEGFENFSETVLVIGRLSSELIENIIYWILFAGNLFLYLRFAYELFTDFSHPDVISTLFLVLILKNVLFLSVLCFCFLKDKKNRLIMRTVPLLYKKKTIPKSYEFRNFVFRIVIPSGITCFLLFIFSLFVDFSDENLIKTMNEYQGEVFISLSLLIYIQVKKVYFFLYKQILF